MNIEKLRAFKIPSATQSYTRRDAMLYALGIGHGSDPLALDQLQYVYEKDLRIVPSICVTLAYPGLWAQDPSLGIDWVRMLNGEYAIRIHRALPPEGTVRSETRIMAVDDKGKEKGAAIYLEKVLTGDDGSPYATIHQSLFLRGDGGCGSFGVPPVAALAMPSRAPDIVMDLPTAANAALIYRLSGDYNAVHSDPSVAREAGFRAPILHGLCSFGMGCRSIVDVLCRGDGDRLEAMSVRFSSPVYPGETLRFEFFRADGAVQWRARVTERDVVVMDRGHAEVRK